MCESTNISNLKKICWWEVFIDHYFIKPISSKMIKSRYLSEIGWVSQNDFVWNFRLRGILTRGLRIWAQIFIQMSTVKVIMENHKNCNFLEISDRYLNILFDINLINFYITGKSMLKITSVSSFIRIGSGKEVLLGKWILLNWPHLVILKFPCPVHVSRGLWLLCSPRMT